MVWVRPGVLLVLAILLPTSELIKLDLPTLERPRNAISGAPAGGNCSGAAAEVTKRVNTFMQAVPPSWTQGARSEKGNRTRTRRACSLEVVVSRALTGVPVPAPCSAAAPRFPESQCQALPAADAPAHTPAHHPWY